MEEGDGNYVWKDIEPNTIENECPITSIKLKVTQEEKSLYEWRSNSQDPKKGIWISRKVKQHGIKRMTVVSTERPEYNGPMQIFWLGRERKCQRLEHCIVPDTYLPSGSEIGFTEWDG